MEGGQESQVVESEKSETGESEAAVGQPGWMGVWEEVDGDEYLWL